MRREKHKKDPYKGKSTWQKTWYFLWKDNSILSWIVNIVLAFILIKFLIYPALGAAFGTSLPVVAVISDSMDHRGMDFDEWWGETLICAPNVNCPQPQGVWYEDKGITKEMFEEYVFINGFNKGDVIILRGVDPDEVKLGDVIVFASKKPYPIIHRVVSVNQDEETKEYIYQTKGDNNPFSIVGPDLNETAVYDYQLLGRATGKIPYVGYVKLIAVDFLNIFR